MLSVRSMIRLAVITAAAVLSGCSDSTSPNGNDPFTGTFDLTTVEDRALPTTVFEGDIVAEPSFHLRIVAKAGAITIDPSGHYEQHVEHDAFIDGVRAGGVDRTDRGECVRSGTQLSCESNYLEGIQFTGTFSGTTLTIAQDVAGEGAVVSYRYTHRD